MPTSPHNRRPARRKPRRPTPATRAAGTKSALSLAIRQPWAELIMLDCKRIEYRSQRTNVRKRIFVYACLGRDARDMEAEWAEEYGLEIDSLPRGVIVGSVELFDSGPDGDGGFEWLLQRPLRAKRLRKPARQPQPVWFRPW
jgi:hypothetical protein